MQLFLTVYAQVMLHGTLITQTFSQTEAVITKDRISTEHSEW